MFNLYWHCYWCKFSRLMMPNLKSIILTRHALQPEPPCEKCGKELCVLVASEQVDSSGIIKVLEVKALTIPAVPPETPS